MAVEKWLKRGKSKKIYRPAKRANKFWEKYPKKRLKYEILESILDLKNEFEIQRDKGGILPLPPGFFEGGLFPLSPACLAPS